MNSEEKERTGGSSKGKVSPVKRVTMSGVEGVDTAAVTEEGNANAPTSNTPTEEAPIMERNGRSFDTDTSSPAGKPLTKIERLVIRMEQRRANRMEVSKRARDRFIGICLNKIRELGATRSNGIPVSTLREMRDEYKENGELGEIVESAVTVSEEADAKVFYFRAFNEYYLAEKESYFRRNPSIGALAGVLAYYICSLILFCGIMGNNDSCPRTGGGPVYEGWLTAIYFASVTISTVGYGDVSLFGDGEVWRVLIGTLYMIIAMVIAVTVFSSLSSKALEFTGGVVAPKLRPFMGKFTKVKKNEKLATQLRRVWSFKILELSLYFLLVNIFGMCVAMIVMSSTKDGDEINWTWMTAFYWAVQTTTTIGYGDLDMPFDLRWFNSFFAIIGTTFAASILGSLADLTSEMENMRTTYIWKNREVSMQLIADMEGDMEGDRDNKLDEYEYLIGSLITLEKLKREDVEEIMDKFRELAGYDHVIDVVDIEDHHRQLSVLQTSTNSDVEASKET